MAERTFSEDEVLHLADQLRSFQASSEARAAMEYIAGRLLAGNMEQNLVETERCRNWFRGYAVAMQALFNAADVIQEQAEKIRNREEPPALP